MYHPNDYYDDHLSDDDDQNVDDLANEDRLVQATGQLLGNTISVDLNVPKDVKFLVGNQKLIEAHKFLLGLRSPVFNRSVSIVNLTLVDYNV